MSYHVCSSSAPIIICTLQLLHGHDLLHAAAAAEGNAFCTPNRSDSSYLRRSIKNNVTAKHIDQNTMSRQSMTSEIDHDETHLSTGAAKQHVANHWNFLQLGASSHGELLVLVEDGLL